MKKLFLAMAVIATTMLAACSSTDKKACEKEECALANKIENCTNPDSLKIYVDQAQAYAEKLVKDGKLDEAQQFLDKISPVVNEKAPALSSTLSSVKSALAAAVATETADSLKNAAGDAVDSLKSAAANAADKVGDAAAAKVEQGKQAAADAVNNAKDKVSEKAQEAKDAAKDKLNSLINN